MALILNIPDLDDADSPYGLVQDFRYGFPVTNLVGLYLLQDGTVGQPYTGVIKDYSGKGNDGALLAGGATPTQQSHGLAFGAAGGFTTPIVATAPYTVIMIPRQRIGASGSVYAIPGYHSTNATLNGTQSYGTGSALVVTQDIQFASDVGKLNIGLFAAGGQPFAGTQSRQQAGPIASVPEQSFFAVGYAVDKNTDRLDFRSTSGATFQTNIGAVTNIARNQPGVHTFGLFRNGAVPIGDLCLALVFNTALSASEIDAALRTAQALVAARGVTVV